MRVLPTRSDLQDVVTTFKSDSLTTGFVPTMGALHTGHLSLIKLAQQKADKVIVSLFVNPTQFAPHEDFDAYPRDIEADCARLKAEGVDIVYTPDTNEIYPNGPMVTVKAGEAAQGLESISRPHFFDGVCSVVSTLFDHVQPDTAVFGEKDFQQLQVLREMVEMQNRKIEIIGAPTIRDEHGLALSSRNAYLSNEETDIARQFNVVLRNARIGIVSHETIGQELLNIGFTKIDYIEKRWDRILAAAWLGKTRLIDNIEFSAA